MQKQSWADTSKQELREGRTISGSARQAVPAAEHVLYPPAIVRQEIAGSSRARHLPSPLGVQSILQLQRTHGNRWVQRMLTLSRKADESGEIEPGVEASIERSRGNGHSMGDGVRRQMESAFGYDFAAVRIHTGANAHSLNRAVNAVAFTTGKDIFFRDGAYSPESRGGKELLAHELTHVVQQGSNGPIQSKLAVGAADSPSEHEADHTASSVMRYLDAVSSSGPGSVQLQCACGGNVASGGECAECKKAREAGGAGAVRRSPLDRSQDSEAHLPQLPLEEQKAENCEDAADEAGARCADHANTMCSVVGGGIAVTGGAIGGAIGSLGGPVGTAIGGAAGGILGGLIGAVEYGHCVEDMNEACRKITKRKKLNCKNPAQPAG